LDKIDLSTDKNLNNDSATIVHASRNSADLQIAISKHRSNNRTISGVKDPASALAWWWVRQDKGSVGRPANAVEFQEKHQ
jgi:hypothetical protein